MKGLAIYSIVAMSIFILGIFTNIASGSAESVGYSLLCIGMIVPVLVFASIFVGGKYNKE